MMQGKRGARTAITVLLLTWVAAGAANADAFIMGYSPTSLGIAASLAAVGVWPLTAWFAATLPGVRFARLSAVFWATVAAGLPALVLAFEAMEGRTVSEGALIVPLLLIVFGAPIYGLYALLPPWDPTVQSAVLGTVVLTTTLAVFFARRHASQA